MRFSFSSAAMVLTSMLTLTSTGCVKAMLADGQIKATREAAPAVETIGDYELARAATQAGLAQFEGMHALRPDNADALFMLLKGWTGYGFAFAQDDYEEAAIHEKEEEAAEHKARAKHAFDRAVNHGRALLKQYDGGFNDVKKREAPLKTWIAKHFTEKDDAPLLYWFGTAWMLRVGLLRDDPAQVATLFVAPAFLEQARALDASFAWYGAELNLAAYHARNAVAELDLAQKMFEDVMKKTGGKALMVQLNYATRYACLTGDRALFDRLLTDVEVAPDPDLSLERGDAPQPDAALRLTNVIAKRKAKRSRTKAFTDDCGFH